MKSQDFCIKILWVVNIHEINGIPLLAGVRLNAGNVETVDGSASWPANTTFLTCSTPVHL